MAIKGWGTPQQHTKRRTLEEFHDESSNSSASRTQGEFRGRDYSEHQKKAGTKAVALWSPPVHHDVATDSKESGEGGFEPLRPHRESRRYPDFLPPRWAGMGILGHCLVTVLVTTSEVTAVACNASGRLHNQRSTGMSALEPARNSGPLSYFYGNAATESGSYAIRKRSAIYAD